MISLLQDELDSNILYDNLFIEVEPIIIREIVLDLLKDLKKGLRQLVLLSRRSIEYRLLLFDIQKKIEEAKIIISTILGNKSEDHEEYGNDFSLLYDFSHKSDLHALIEMVELTEKKLNSNDIVEALAFFLALYEEMISNFCDHCIFDAA